MFKNRRLYLVNFCFKYIILLIQSCWSRIAEQIENIIFYTQRCRTTSLENTIRSTYNFWKLSQIRKKIIEVLRWAFWLLSHNWKELAVFKVFCWKFQFRYNSRFICLSNVHLYMLKDMYLFQIYMFPQPFRDSTSNHEQKYFFFLWIF